MNGFKGRIFSSCPLHIALSVEDPVNSQNIDDIATKEGKQYVRYCVYRYILMNMKMRRNIERLSLSIPQPLVYVSGPVMNVFGLKDVLVETACPLTDVMPLR